MDKVRIKEVDGVQKLTINNRAIDAIGYEVRCIGDEKPEVVIYGNPDVYIAALGNPQYVVLPTTIDEAVSIIALALNEEKLDQKELAKKISAELNRLRRNEDG